MKITIELSANFGHPNNRPDRAFILEEATKELVKILEKCKGTLSGWGLTSIRVD